MLSPNPQISIATSHPPTPREPPSSMPKSDQVQICEPYAAHLTINEIKARWLEAVKYYETGHLFTATQRYSRLLTKLNQHVDSVTSENSDIQVSIAYAQLTSSVPHISTLPLIAAQLWFNIGLIQCLLSEVCFGEAAFKQSVEYDPSLIVGWYMLGVMRSEQGRLEEAFTAFEKAYELTLGGEEDVDWSAVDLTTGILPGDMESEVDNNEVDGKDGQCRKKKTPLSVMISLKQSRFAKGIETVLSPNTPTFKPDDPAPEITPRRKWRLPSTFLESTRRLEKLLKQEHVPKPKDGKLLVQGIPIGAIFLPEKSLGLPESYGPYKNPAVPSDTIGMKRTLSLSQFPCGSSGRSPCEDDEFGPRSVEVKKAAIALPARSSSLSAASMHKPLPPLPRLFAPNLQPKQPQQQSPPPPSSACPDPLAIRKCGIAKLRIGTDRRNAARNVAPVTIPEEEVPLHHRNEPVLAPVSQAVESKPAAIARDDSITMLSSTTGERKSGTLHRSASVLAVATALKEGLAVTFVGKVPDMPHEEPDYSILHDIAQLSPPTTYSPGSSNSPLDILANLKLLVPSPPESLSPLSPTTPTNSATHSHPIPSPNLSPPTRTAPLPSLPIPESPTLGSAHGHAYFGQHEDCLNSAQHPSSTAKAVAKPRAFTNPNPNIHPYASAYVPSLVHTSPVKNTKSTKAADKGPTHRYHHETQSSTAPSTSYTTPSTCAPCSSSWSDDLYQIPEGVPVSGPKSSSSSQSPPIAHSALSATPSTGKRMKRSPGKRGKRSIKLESPIEALDKLDEAFAAAKPVYPSPSSYSTVASGGWSNTTSPHDGSPYAPLAVIAAYERGSLAETSQASSTMLGINGGENLAGFGARGKEANGPSSVYSCSTGIKGAGNGSGRASSVYSRSTGGKKETGGHQSSSVHSRSIGGDLLPAAVYRGCSGMSQTTERVLLPSTVYRGQTRVSYATGGQLLSSAAYRG